MGKRSLKTTIDYLALGIFWFAISTILGLFIVLSTRYNFKDVLFVEGMILIMVGISFEVGYERTWLSLQPLGSPNAQYVSNMNLEVAKIEEERKKNSHKVLVSRGLSSAPLIMGGAISLLVNFIL